MSEDPVEVVRRFHEAYGREDWDVTDSILADDTTFTPSANHPLYDTYRGKDELHAYFRAWLGAWERLKHEVREVEELDPGVVLAHIWTRVRGKSSGVVLEADDFLIHHVRDGRITETRTFATEAEAREAAA